jgi:hypothetical protein
MANLCCLKSLNRLFNITGKFSAQLTYNKRIRFLNISVFNNEQNFSPFSFVCSWLAVLVPCYSLLNRALDGVLLKFETTASLRSITS